MTKFMVETEKGNIFTVMTQEEVIVAKRKATDFSCVKQIMRFIETSREQSGDVVFVNGRWVGSVWDEIPE